MKIRFSLITLVLINLSITTVFAKSNPASLQHNIDRAIVNFGENVNIGILVKDASTGKTLYQKMPAAIFHRPAMRNYSQLMLPNKLLAMNTYTTPTFMLTPLISPMAY